MGDFLEQQVRNGLREKHAENLYEKIQEPEFQEYSLRMTKNLLGSMMSGEDEEEVSELMQLIEASTKAFLSNPEQLKAKAKESARNQYLTEEQFYDLMGEAFFADFDYEASTAALKNEVDQITRENFSKYVSQQDDYVARLVEIAELEGLDEALSDETEAMVTREMYSTKAEYLASMKEGLKVVQDYMSEIQKVVMKEVPGVAQELEALFGDVQEMLDTENPENALLEREFQSKADRIYGV